jgi:hypothetical protein
MTALESVGVVLTVAHILGLAAVVAPFLLQSRLRAGFDLRTVLVGSIVQLVAGFGLVGLSQVSEGLDSLRVVIRVLLTLLVVCAAFIAQDRQRRVQASRIPDTTARIALYVAGAAAIGSLVLTVLWP